MGARNVFLQWLLNHFWLIIRLQVLGGCHCRRQFEQGETPLPVHIQVSDLPQSTHPPQQCMEISPVLHARATARAFSI